MARSQSDQKSKNCSLTRQVRAAGDRAPSAQCSGAPLQSTRTRGEVAYKLTPLDQDQATRVDISVDYNLQGSLAQFSRSSLAQEFARQLVARFAANCSAQLGGKPLTTPSSDTLKLGNLLWLAIRAGLKRIFSRAH